MPVCAGKVWGGGREVGGQEGRHQGRKKRTSGFPRNGVKERATRPEAKDPSSSDAAEFCPESVFTFVIRYPGR